jgi:hypothetical protein
MKPSVNLFSKCYGFWEKLDKLRTKHSHADVQRAMRKKWGKNWQILKDEYMG